MQAKRFVYVAVAVIAVLLLGGCERPDLVIKDAQVTSCGPDPSSQTGQHSITYTFTIENRDYGGNIFIRPGSITDRIYVQAVTSADTTYDGSDSPAGGTSLIGQDFGPDDVLSPGESINGEFSASFSFNPSMPNLVLVVDPGGADGNGQIREHRENNNQTSTVIRSCKDFDITCALTTGLNTLALPYNRQTGLNDAQDLMNDIGGAVVSVRRYREDEQPNPWETHSGGLGAFALTAGEGLMVEVSSDVNYRIRGSHDPSIALQLDAPGPMSAAGKNFIALPYHTTAGDAQQLLNDIGSANVVNVQEYDKATDTWTVYSGSRDQAFPIDPCKSYMVQMSNTASFVPPHY